MISVPCFEETLELWCLFLAWLLVSTTVAKSAVSQEYYECFLVLGFYSHVCMKDFPEGSGKGFFSQRQSNSSHFIDGMWLIYLSRMFSVLGSWGTLLSSRSCSSQLCTNHPHALRNASACLQLQLLASALQAFTHLWKSWPVALKGTTCD